MAKIRPLPNSLTPKSNHFYQHFASKVGPKVKLFQQLRQMLLFFNEGLLLWYLYWYGVFTLDLATLSTSLTDIICFVLLHSRQPHDLLKRVWCKGFHTHIRNVSFFTPTNQRGISQFTSLWTSVLAATPLSAWVLKLFVNVQSLSNQNY